MSKATLKKALDALTQEQITEMVLDLYAARPEAKEYLDFWVSGDIDSKMTKAKNAIAKETARAQRGRPRPRMTKIKRFIKDIVSLNADSEAIGEIMTYSIERMCAIGSDKWVKESTQKSTAKLLHDTLTYIRKNGIYAIFIQRLRGAIENMRTDNWWSRDFSTLLEEEMRETLLEYTSPEQSL